MAFVQEDGTGLSTANSYASVAYADTYFLDRGITNWTGTNSDKQYYLIRATDYIENVFGTKFKGERKFPDVQALSFPRDKLSDLTTAEIDLGIPNNLIKATVEYALRARASTLLPDPTIDVSGLIVQSLKEKVGPLEVDTSYAVSGSGSIAVLIRPYPAADALLRSLIVSSGKVIRA